MSRPGIEEVNFHDFMSAVKTASDKGFLLERKDKEKWKEYVTENSVRDVSLEAHAKVKFSYGKPVLVAITKGPDWVGCYAYSKDDEAVLKYVP